MDMTAKYAGTMREFDQILNFVEKVNRIRKFHDIRLFPCTVQR
jgi:hypothetical protein